MSEQRTVPASPPIPDPFGSPRKLWIIMAGGNHDNQQRIAKAIDAMGLMDRVQFGRQVIVPYGLHTDYQPDRQSFPADFDESQGDEISRRMYDWTRWTDHDWHPLGKPWAFGFYNYEPMKYGPSGEILGNWMLDKLRNGYNHTDHWFLRAIIRGGQAALDGLPMALYNSPIVWQHTTLTGQGRANIKSFKPTADRLDWLWSPHLYPSGVPELDYIPRGHESERMDRIAEKYNATSELVAGLGKPSVPFTWPHGRMAPPLAANFQSVTIELVNRLPVNRYGFWFDSRNDDEVTVQIRNFQLARPSIERFLQP